MQTIHPQYVGPSRSMKPLRVEIRLHAMVEMNAWRYVPTLHGTHVMLRPPVESDREGLLAATADTAGWDNFYLIAPSREKIDEWFGEASEEREWRRSMSFVVCRPDDGLILGKTHYVRMNEKARRLEIGGTFLAKSTRRSGVNTESKRLLLGYAFEVLNCNVVQIRTDALHYRSRAAIERLGARCDGLLRRHSVMSDGRVRDLLVFSIIADEWPNVSRHIDHLLASHDACDKPSKPEHLARNG